MMNSESTRTTLLRAGASVPVLYFGTILVASLFYPGYSHVRQYASELGARGAPHPAIFNLGIIACGGAAIAGSLGMFAALRGLAANYFLSISTASVLFLSGLCDIISGLFPLPDPRHNAFDIGYVVLLGPPLLVAAIWKHRDLSWLKLYSIVSYLALVAMVAILMGVGGFVTRATVGAFQRLTALTWEPWIGVASYALLRKSIRAEAKRSVAK